MIRLSAPKNIVWIIAVILGALGALGGLAVIQIPYAFFLLLTGFLLLAIATAVKGM